ncbi:MAG: hypothetical protein ACJ79L_06780 [Anaeromyxobacteraceae bacterium]
MTITSLRVRAIGAVLLGALAACEARVEPLASPPAVAVAPLVSWSWQAGAVSCLGATSQSTVRAGGEPLAVVCVWRGCAWSSRAMMREVGVTFIRPPGGEWLAFPNEIVEVAAQADECSTFIEPPEPPGPVTIPQVRAARLLCGEVVDGCPDAPWGTAP